MASKVNAEALVECVPNISEGRDRQKIDLIVAAAATVENVDVLDVDPGSETNRTVITLVGPPDPIAEAAFRLVETAERVQDQFGVMAPGFADRVSFARRCKRALMATG